MIAATFRTASVAEIERPPKMLSRIRIVTRSPSLHRIVTTKSGGTRFVGIHGAHTSRGSIGENARSIRFRSFAARMDANRFARFAFALRQRLLRLTFIFRCGLFYC
jgi:hypothetical protein